MSGEPITEFEPDADRLAVIRECMENYDVGDPDDEWPNNIISRWTVVYGSGVIARRGVQIRHTVDPEELALCRVVAGEAAAMMSGVDVGMGSESTDPFRDFFITANVGEPSPLVISAPLIRDKFSGVIFPAATITLEPLEESGVWWSEVQEDGSGSGQEYFVPWRAMIRWFRNRPEFVNSAFVRIGDRRALWDVPRMEYPEGTVITGCVLPRMALGLTRRGSLVGLLGYSVQT